MLNSWSLVNACFYRSKMYGYANLLNRHHNLHGVQAVQTEVVGEVSAGRELRMLLATIIGMRRGYSYFRRVGDLASIVSLQFK